ncbi:kinase-like domain-containing protein [Rhizophagus diaphanus]|nr:kinase-like domain-containing protein [Rhizophagus diaphanus] [Rhizophagus sp. MUCL 43196]
MYLQRRSHEKVDLYGSRSISEFLLDEVNKTISYGTTQSSNIKDYIVLESKLTDWTSKIKQIEAFNIHKKKFKWISLDRLSYIKEIEKIGATAIWMNGNDLIKSNGKVVALKYLHNLQHISDELLSRVKSEDICFGISQSPDTNNFIFVFYEKYYENYCDRCCKKYTNKNYKWCKPCQINYLKGNFTNWTSGDKKIDEFIQKKLLQINSPQDLMFEWIPYNQFSNIKKRKNGVAAAVWKDGPLKFDEYSKKYERNLNRNVALKYLYGSQYITDEFLNKVKSYLMEDISYGISQNSNTKDYILVFHEKKFENSFEYLNNYLEKCSAEHSEKYCVKCSKEHTNEVYRWCKSCMVNSKNIRIINIIKNSSKIKWISYNQFNDINEIGIGGFATVYSAIWNNGKVALKCLHNSQNFIYEFINEVEVYLAYTNQKFSNILKIYGISQNPDTEEFIIVLEYAEGGTFNDYLYRNYQSFNWSSKIQILMNIIKGLKEIHQKQMVHRDFHTKNILFKHIEYINICISDMGLCGEVGNIDKTKIIGGMPFVAPEVLRRIPYTQAADIYSFGMIMYFVATGRQTFANRAHDKLLALDICNGIRPEINEQRAPKCYIDLM